MENSTVENHSEFSEYDWDDLWDESFIEGFINDKGDIIE